MEQAVRRQAAMEREERKLMRAAQHKEEVEERKEQQMLGRGNEKARRVNAAPGRRDAGAGTDAQAVKKMEQLLEQDVLKDLRKEKSVISRDRRQEEQRAREQVRRGPKACLWLGIGEVCGADVALARSSRRATRRRGARRRPRMTRRCVEGGGGEEVDALPTENLIGVSAGASVGALSQRQLSRNEAGAELRRAISPDGRTCVQVKAAATGSKRSSQSDARQHAQHVAAAQHHTGHAQPQPQHATAADAKTQAMAGAAASGRAELFDVFADVAEPKAALSSSQESQHYLSGGTDPSPRADHKTAGHLHNQAKQETFTIWNSIFHDTGTKAKKPSQLPLKSTEDEAKHLLGGGQRKARAAPSSPHQVADAESAGPQLLAKAEQEQHEEAVKAGKFLRPAQ